MQSKILSNHGNAPQNNVTTTNVIYALNLIKQKPTSIFKEIIKIVVKLS